jgi:hypothetical protein
MKHIPPPNETKTLGKKSKTKFFYLVSKGMDVATCFGNKEVMLDGRTQHGACNGGNIF